IEQLLGLVITEGLCLPFITLNPRPFDTIHWVTAGDCIVLQEMIKQAGQCRQFASNRGIGQASQL
ncbi:hypothetical protein PSYPI_42370, partial [Pseudomonas syringae pv. pisi str. 1704B]